MYTLGQAAKATGKSKPALSDAIKKGRFSAEKQEDGSYKIDPAELHRVYPPIGSVEPKTEQFITPITAEKLAEIKGLERTLKSMEELLIQVKGERDRAWQEADHWRHRCLALEAPKQAFPDPAMPKAALPEQEATPRKPGFFARLFGAKVAA